MACPGYHYHRKAFLAYKRRTETKKKGGRKREGKKKHRERETTTAPTVPSPRVQFFFLSFSFFPSADQRTHQPLYLSISFSSLHLQV
jgi:hypothetical protein